MATVEETKRKIGNMLSAKLLKSKKEYDKLYKFCETQYEKVACGSSRCTYIINNNYIIKLAYTNVGIEQNKQEIKLYEMLKGDKNFNFLARILWKGKFNIWLIMERIKPISRDAMEEFLKIDIEKVDAYLRMLIVLGKDQLNKIAEKNNEVSYLMKQQQQNTDIGKFITFLYSLITKFKENMNETLLWEDDDLNIAGIGIRNNGSIAMYDYGMSKEIGEKYYEFKKNNWKNLGSLIGF